MHKQPYTLVADLGNTSLTLGLFRNGKITRRINLLHTQVRGNDLRAALQRMMSSAKVRGVSFGSVVPSLNARCGQVIRRMVEGPFLQVNDRCDFGIRISYPKPETIGVDRLVNAAWAVNRYGTPVIVCDLGTATTIDLVLPEKGFVGGVILPGPSLMLDYLAERTELLPEIQAGNPVRKAYGRSTEEAMQIGARQGYAGMIRGVVEHMLEEHAGPFAVCMTGGYAGKTALPAGMNTIVDRNITLCGLGYIFERMAGA